MVKQDEEGALIYNRQSVFGVELRTDGYGVFYEYGKRTTRRKANLYSAEFSEIKDPKEEKTPNGFFTVNNPYVYGKQHNFYQLKLGFGQQYLFGQKGNKNGVALFLNYQGGFSWDCCVLTTCRYRKAMAAKKLNILHRIALHSWIPRSLLAVLV